MMVPNTLTSYKVLNEEYKCSSYTIRAISYIISFKFSLLLVSYFWMSPRFKGDYSALNWKQFNRFSLSYIIVPAPVMVFSCAYFIYVDGVFSYAAFAAMEVAAITTLMTCILLLDAMSTCRCNCGNTKKAPYLPHKVATGAEYESEDDDPGKKLMKKRREGGEEFGADESMPNRDEDTIARMKGT